MIDQVYNETLAYLNQKAPPESNRRKVLTGLKQQQYITQFINQSTNPKMPEGNNGSKVDNNISHSRSYDMGWGKVR